MNDNADTGGADLRSVEYDPPLVTLPGAGVSPEVLLHRTINKLARIKGVVVIIQWDDDSIVMDWSTMKVSELCMAEKVMSLTVAEEVCPTGEPTPSAHE